MDDLILTMLVTYNEYGDILGFNKSDIDNFIKKYNYLDNIRCNERGYIVLWNSKYIDDEKFGKLMDIEIKDNKLYLVCDGFDDILDKDYDNEISILNGEMNWLSYDVYDNDVSSYWSDYDEETIKIIYDFCINNELEIEGEIMTSENTEVKNDDVLFNDASLKEYINDEDGLDELRSELNIAIVEAQESADQSEIYHKIRSTFIDEIGEFDWKGKKLYIEIDKELIDDTEKYLIDQYGDFDFDTENYGSLLYILKEMETFDIRFPNLDNIYGSIEDDILNECTQNRLL